MFLNISSKNSSSTHPGGIFFSAMLGDGNSSPTIPKSCLSPCLSEAPSNNCRLKLMSIGR
ncbi:hypothetical protein T11_570 [Trichinella zimbabwensis]|uniref:Uncharacterized protein n=1 Tax=Trichinella zimbabwensis TaxID=268475 RepID=A0A0V1HQR4_9BILA|nr:hypothetical protein T11_570 [Trichinella zimbabwensis]